MRSLQLLQKANGLANPSRILCQSRGANALRFAPVYRSAQRFLPSRQSQPGFSFALRRLYATTTSTIDLNPAAASESNNAGKDGGAEDAKDESAGGKKPKPKLQIKWYWKALIILGEISICDYLFDKYVLGGVMWRTTLTYLVLARVGLDYKLHYGRDCMFSRHPDEDIHHRNAERVCSMLRWNGGLYLKAGQAVAMQGGVLPEEYQRMFGEMFDDAPHSSWSDVQKVIKEDFGGRSVEEIFSSFEQEPKASASIAQVHFAKLADGTPVAVKVQRREIAKQVSWDLWSMKIMTDYTAWMTGLAFGDIAEFVTDRVMQETDFENEASNAERTAELIASDPSLRDRVYIPKVYRELTSKRVLTTEWIDGVQLWDKDRITGAHQLASATTTGDSDRPNGLGLRINEVVHTVIELFSVQMFNWGFVHCDPHPGNILVRRHPNGSGKHQVVLLDHGLYITLPDKLRRQYGRFWKALVTNDDVGLQKVSDEWGMNNANAWADASLMRPYKTPEGQSDSTWQRSKETKEERKERMIAEAASYLGEEGLFPQEIVFLERNIAIVQGNNRFLGSPVNRIKLIGLCALRAVKKDGEEQTTMRQALTMRVALMSLDFVFWWSQIRQYFGYGSGFEEDLKDSEDRQLKEMKDAMAEMLGITVD